MPDVAQFGAVVGTWTASEHQRAHLGIRPRLFRNHGVHFYGDLLGELKPANAFKSSSSDGSVMMRGTLFCPPSLPRRFIQLAKVPGVTG